jgi:hypothetical protein
VDGPGTLALAAVRRSLIALLSVDLVLITVLIMRYLLVFGGLASVLVVAGCDERTSLRAVPDRDHHAYVDSSVQIGDDNRPLAGPGEIYITTGPHDTLTSVAMKYHTTIKQLIWRNQLTNTENPLPPGTNLIVPNPDAPPPAAAPGAPPAP